MERERYSDEDLVEREVEAETEDPEPSEETEFERRSGLDVVHQVDPSPPRERASAIYGDTDIDPNRQDQFTMHHVEDDEQF